MRNHPNRTNLRYVPLKRKHSGMTLVEIMVVIACISLLTLVVVHQYTHTMDNGRATATALDLMRICLAVTGIASYRSHRMTKAHLSNIRLLQVRIQPSRSWFVIAQPSPETWHLTFWYMAKPLQIRLPATMSAIHCIAGFFSSN